MTSFEPTKSDSLDEVLRIASEVIDENAPDPQNTRLERLATWLAKNVGGSPDAVMEVSSQPGWVNIMPYSFTPTRAREVAVALLRAAERAER